MFNKEKFSHSCCLFWEFSFYFFQTLSFTHLFLTQDQDTSRFNWVPRSKILPSAKLLSILKSLPHSISGCPCYTDMMPFSITNEERELGDLQKPKNNTCCKPSLPVQAQHLKRDIIYSVLRSKKLQRQKLVHIFLLRPSSPIFRNTSMLFILDVSLCFI